MTHSDHIRQNARCDYDAVERAELIYYERRIERASILDELRTLLGPALDVPASLDALFVAQELHSRLQAESERCLSALAAFQAARATVRATHPPRVRWPSDAG